MFYTLSVSRLQPLLGVRHDEQTGAMLLALQLAIIAFGPPWTIQLVNFVFIGWALHAARLPAGVCQRTLGRSARDRAVAAFVFFFMGRRLVRFPSVLAS
jgi:MFS transporter, DHA1 family, inner membrane transport protein